MGKVLIIKLGAFGDVIQSDGAIRDIRAHHPQDEIVVMTTPAFRKIFERCPHINRVLVAPRAPRWRLDLMYKLRQQLRAEQFDMVYDLQNADRTCFYYTWFLRGTPWSGIVRGCSHRYVVDNHRKVPSLQRHAAQLTAAGVKVVHTLEPDVSWLADDATPILAAEKVSTPYIVLITGCSARHPQKRWPYYNQLAEKLMAQGLEVVTVPGPDELADVKTFPGKVLLGPRGFYNWFELAGILKQARFVVGNDTGPSHLAAHLGVQGLALFGPHASALSTSIERAAFKALEVPELASLSVAQVLNEVNRRLASA